MVQFSYRSVSFVNTCGGSNGAEVTVADDLQSKKRGRTKLNIFNSKKTHLSKKSQ